jgi:hypothetical protein
MGILRWVVLRVSVEMMVVSIAPSLLQFVGGCSIVVVRQRVVEVVRVVVMGMGGSITEMVITLFHLRLQTLGLLLL